MDHTLRHLVHVKSNIGLVTAPSTDTVFRVVHVMNARGVGAVLITKGDQLIGIFTERDLLRRVLAGGHDPVTTLVSAVMTSPIRCASPDMPMSMALRLMTEARHRHLPVVENGVVIGIVSIGDLTHYMSRQLRQSVSDLSMYINGPASSVELPYVAEATVVTHDSSPELDAPCFVGVLRYENRTAPTSFASASS